MPLKVDIINMYKYNTKRQNSNYYTLKLSEKEQIDNQHEKKNIYKPLYLGSEEEHGFIFLKQRF